MILCANCGEEIVVCERGTVWKHYWNKGKDHDMRRCCLGKNNGNRMAELPRDGALTIWNERSGLR